ncbi:hypothetical protein SLEP1_g22160 [Rubroshorea leprosula]|uniref:Uncharacterized protein n=1 Tax=Rubroshorea leprosula TaxID=152421 RepID=A0AAV5JFM3_9ROSI|nr:hypothetical protein SLEP1_g22160 [Rubroshorea leprosula]
MAVLTEKSKEFSPTNRQEQRMEDTEQSRSENSAEGGSFWVLYVF